MNDIIDIEAIIQKQKYHPIYNIGLILIILLFIFIYISSIYKYKTYYITKGTVVDENIKLLVNVEDIKYINNNNYLEIESIKYKYSIKEISEELYIDEQLNNYKYIYLNIPNLNNINNYVYEIKLEKENKTFLEHLKKYI